MHGAAAALPVRDEAAPTDFTSSVLSQVQEKLQTVVQAATQPPPKAADAGGQPLKIFVGGLSQLTTKETLDTYFAQFGYSNSYIMMDKATGRSRGFGFVNFAEEAVMQSVLEYSHEVDGVTITVSPYKGGDAKAASMGQAPSTSLGNTAADIINNAISLISKLQGQLDGSGGAAPEHVPHRPPEGSKIFVGGLPPATTSASLQDAFRPHGSLESEVVLDKFTGRSRGFGFVTFSTVAAADAAMQAQHIVDGRPVEVSECWEKGAGPSKGGRKGGPSRFSPY